MWRSGSTREHATVRRVIAELVTYVICVFGVSVKPLWQVMTAASYWSLLAPAIEMAEVSGSYGVNGEWAFLPVAIGFGLGAVFVYAADVFMPYLVCYCSESILLLFCVQYLLLHFYTHDRYTSLYFKPSTHCSLHKCELWTFAGLCIVLWYM